MEDGAIGLVAEHDIVENDGRLADCQRRGARLVGHFYLCIHQLEHFAHVDQPLPDRAIDEAKHVERPEQLGEISLYRDQVADRQYALRPLPDGKTEGEKHQAVHHERLRYIEQPERVLAFDGSLCIGAGCTGVAFFLACLGTEVFDGLVIKQRVDRSRKRGAVEFVHPAAKCGAPFGDPARHQYIDRNGDGRGNDHFHAKHRVEDYAECGQLDHGRCDVEQQEIEHRIDALGPALDRLRDLPRTAGEMEAQRKPVQSGKDIFCQLAGCVLPDTLENDIADVVEANAHEPPDCICCRESQRDPEDIVTNVTALPRHGVDHALQRKRSKEDDGLGAKDQQHRANYARA